MSHGKQPFYLQNKINACKSRYIKINQYDDDIGYKNITSCSLGEWGMRQRRKSSLLRGMVFFLL
ncbi:hypothetical protein CJP46_08455 [Paenibacillus sp. XY044]|nr:hypothetical protein CJP46_08455 [Paenibacillus sp. XY044]